MNDPTSEPHINNSMSQKHSKHKRRYKLVKALTWLGSIYPQSIHSAGTDIGDKAVRLENTQIGPITLLSILSSGPMNFADTGDLI